MGAKFETEDGETPYADLSKDEVPEELKILKLNDILDYLIEQGGGKYKYIIEIKNSGDLGKEGVDILYSVLQEKGIIDKVVFGTFHKEVSEYVDEKYPDLARSTSIAEVFDFWTAALNDDEDYAAVQCFANSVLCAVQKPRHQFGHGTNDKLCT